jgi:hypothetical protein
MVLSAVGTGRARLGSQWFIRYIIGIHDEMLARKHGRFRTESGCAEPGGPLSTVCGRRVNITFEPV